MMLSNEEMPHPDLNALAAFAEGRLGARERVALGAHAADCAECRTMLATLARASRTATPLRWLPLAATLVLAGTAAVAVWQIQRTSPAVHPFPQPPSTSA